MRDCDFDGAVCTAPLTSGISVMSLLAQTIVDQFVDLGEADRCGKARSVLREPENADEERWKLGRLRSEVNVGDAPIPRAISKR